MPLTQPQNKNQFPERNTEPPSESTEHEPEYTSDPQSLALQSAISSGELTNDLWVRNCEHASEEISTVPVELDYFIDSVERAKGLEESLQEKLVRLADFEPDPNPINGTEQRRSLTYDELQDSLLLLEDWPKNLLETSIAFTFGSKLFQWPNSTHAKAIHQVSLDTVIAGGDQREIKRAVIALAALGSRELLDGASRDESYFVGLLGLAPEERIY